MKWARRKRSRRAGVSASLPVSKSLITNRDKVSSPGMQLAKSGLIFAAFAFISFILTGKLFYFDEEEEAS